VGAKGKHEAALRDLERVEKMARDGYTDEQLAKALGVSRSTLNVWKVRFPELSDTIKRGKDFADDAVENALVMAATGYTYQEITREPQYNAITGEPVLDEKGNHKIVITKIVEKVAHPNVTALIFHLKNRRPDVWGGPGRKVADVVAGDGW
jgi:hypothetical protein